MCGTGTAVGMVSQRDLLAYRARAMGSLGDAMAEADTAAALRASEMGCDALLKGTKVDGVYSADPVKDPEAVRFDRLTYHDVLAKDLKVMDASAISLARESAIPIIVFSVHHPGALRRVLHGDGAHTMIAEPAPRPEEVRS